MCQIEFGLLVRYGLTKILILYLFLLGWDKQGNKKKGGTSSTTSSISTKYMWSVLEQLKCQSNRDSTRRSYHKIWTRFNKFIIKLDIKPKTWEERVALFAAQLVEEGKKSSTIQSYVSAIKGTLKKDNYEWCDNKVLLASIIGACKIKNDLVKTRFPIRIGLLEIMLFEIDRIFANQPYLETLLKAYFAISYYGLFRVGELAAGDHQVKACDVHMAINKKKILVILHSSKTHSRGSLPQKVKITGRIDTKCKRNFCPFELTNRYIEIRGDIESIEEAFFVLKGKLPVSPTMIRDVLRQILSNLNLDSRLYDTHSLRIGRATDLLKQGYKVEEIMQLGRWKSNVVFKYLRT